MELPVATTNVPHIPELIERGKDGILVRDKDPQALADAIDKLLNDKNKRIKLGKMARRKIEDKFEANEHIKKIADIFGQMGQSTD